MSRLAPPTGAQPPEEAHLADGESVALRPLAEEVCVRYRREFPDEDERYGDAGMAWCIHDNRYILAWAIESLHPGYVDYGDKIAWLARVLDARDFPLERLARDLEIAAEVVRDRRLPGAEELARRLLSPVESLLTRSGDADGASAAADERTARR